MITGGQLAFGFGQVERAAVGFRITRNKIDDERYNSRDMPFEYKPAVGLSGYDFCIVPIRTTIVRILSPQESS